MGDGGALGRTYFLQVNLPTNDIGYDPHSDMIYASVPSTAGATRGTTITPIDPHTGALGTSVFVASEPSILALANTMEFDATGTRLYTHINSISSFDFSAFPIRLTGTHAGIGPAVYGLSHVLSQCCMDIEYDNGRVYFTNGQVFDAETGNPVGSFASGNGPVEPESSLGRTYFINDGLLKTFSQTTFVPIASLPIPGLTGSPRNLISLGDDGLAFATSAGKVYIARGSLIEGPTADFNEDDQVDGADFLIWQAGLGLPDAELGQGDADGNGKVDAADLAVWKTQFGQVTPLESARSIPEPASAVLLAVALLALHTGSRWNSSRPHGRRTGVQGSPA